MDISWMMAAFSESIACVDLPLEYHLNTPTRRSRAGSYQMNTAVMNTKVRCLGTLAVNHS